MHTSGTRSTEPYEPQWPVAPIGADHQTSGEPEVRLIDTVYAILDSVYEAPGNDGRMMLAVLIDGHEKPLGLYLASDINKMLNHGQLSKEEFQHLHDKIMKKLKHYKGARIGHAALGTPMLTGPEMRVGWEGKELAAGEHLQGGVQ